MPKPNPRRPYQHFKWRTYSPAAWTADISKIEEAAKLLQLPSADEKAFDFYIQRLAEDYHGEPGVTASAADLKRALKRFSEALTEASNAWAALHDPPGTETGLLLGVLAAIEETYHDRYVEAFVNGNNSAPRFNDDLIVLERLESMVATTTMKIVPDPSGPAPEPRFGLAAEVFAIARYCTGRNLTFGASARAAREIRSGGRTDDYRACVLMMQAVDPALADSQCEGPLEAALNTGKSVSNRTPRQGVRKKTRVRRKK